MRKPLENYCTKCGNTEIISEATCSWDVVTQDWTNYEVELHDGNDECAVCYSKKCEFRYVTDVKTLAKIAIHKGDT